MKRFYRKSLTAFAIALFSGIVIVWCAGSFMVRGRASFVAPATAPALDVVLREPDGVRLRGTYRPGVKPAAPAVLFLHGVDASRAMSAGNATYLSSRGYATLTIDFRGHGQSTITERSFGLFEARDAAAAFAWLKARQHASTPARRAGRRDRNLARRCGDLAWRRWATAG